MTNRTGSQGMRGYEAVLQEVVGAKKRSEKLSLPDKSIVLTFIYNQVSGFF